MAWGWLVAFGRVGTMKIWTLGMIFLGDPTGLDHEGSNWEWCFRRLLDGLLLIQGDPCTAELFG